MRLQNLNQRLVSLSLVAALLAAPVLAQRRNPPPRKPQPIEVAQPAPTFDTLLAADSYKAYFEVRGVGGLINSPAVNEILEPVRKTGGTQPEFDALVKWLKEHAEVLAGSRMLIAAWPSRPKLPNFLLAIELSSAEEAKQFYPQLRDFIPKILPTPTPTPTPTPLPAPSPLHNAPGTAARNEATRPVVVLNSAAARSDTDTRSAPATAVNSIPPYHLQQSGNLLFISDAAFTFRNLRPPRSKPLEEDQNFVLARNRFASESVFIYVDLKAIEKEEREQQKRWAEEEQKRIDREAANPPKVAAPAESETEQADIISAPEPTPFPTPDSIATPALVGPFADAQGPAGTLPSERVQEPDITGPVMSAFSRAIFGGRSKWPEAVSLALVFEDDAYVLRTLVINSEENKAVVLPFVPGLLSGPALAPEAPGIFPAETEFYVSASLNYAQIYEELVEASTDPSPPTFMEQNVSRVGSQPTSPFAVYEAKLGIKIKDDVLPLLGSEIALALLKKAPTPETDSTANPARPGANNRPETAKRNSRSADLTPVIAVAVKDREAVSRLLPKIVESLGFKGASLLAQTEKRDGTELTSYGDLFAYAFVGDFLVLSADAASTRQVVEAFRTQQTLAANSRFRNFTRWQPRQVLGQVYVAPALVEEYSAVMLRGGLATGVNEAGSRASSVIDPLTYSLTNDGLGPLHELHVPNNLLQLLLANLSQGPQQTDLQRNEASAKGALYWLAHAEGAFRDDQKNGRYGTLDELSAAGVLSKDGLEVPGYTISLTVSENKFEALAVPVEYASTGRLSFFIDESRVLRAGDHGGGAATVADEPE